MAEGKALFAVGCASCHGLNGEGQINAPIQGPPLAGVGAAAVDFQVSTGRMPMARPGEQAPVKPNVYSEEEVAALAAFVASLGPGPAIPEPAEYDTSGHQRMKISPAAVSCSVPTAPPVTTSRAPVAHCPTANTRPHWSVWTISASIWRC